jgi:hypothetical protein
MSSRHTVSKNLPSVPTEGSRSGRLLFLKAANDNRPPLLKTLSSLFMILAPTAALTAFAAIWFYA